MKVLLFINFSIIRILIFPTLILQHDSKNPPINPFFYHAPQPCPFIAIFPGYTNSNSRDGTETFTQCNYKWPETFMWAVIDPLCTCKEHFIWLVHYFITGLLLDIGGFTYKSPTSQVYGWCFVIFLNHQSMDPVLQSSSKISPFYGSINVAKVVPQSIYLK